MTTTMDSPDRNPIVPSTDCQGSPFFHFLCSLSPIKGVTSSGCGARTFSELSFPPPPPVFVSPKVESRKDGAPKRKILAGSAHDKQEECNVSIKSSLQVLSGSNKETLSSMSAANSSPTSTSMPDLTFPITHTSSVEQELRLHMQDSKGLFMVSSENEDVKEPFDKPPTVHLSSQSNPEKKLDQPTQHLSCQTTTENNHKAPELSRHNLEKLHAVWSVPMDYLSRILTSMRGTPAVEDDDPPGSSESDLPQAITETSSLHENEELEAEGEQHFCRANPSGFRRRCLDFQTSDIHQKALHNLPMLRMIGLSSDNPSRTGFPTTLDNNTVTPFPEYHAMKYPSMEHQRSTSNVWDNSMPTDFDLSEVPPCQSIPNPAQRPHYNASCLANQCENSQVINNKRFTFGLEAAQAALQVSRLGYSFPSISQSRVDGADNLPLSMQSKGSLSKSFLKGKTDIQQNLSSNLVDQELLLSLAETTIINQHHYQGENNAAHVALQTPTAFHQPIAVEFDTIHRNPGELGSRSTAVLENTAIAQESSHQSESDHLEEFTCSPRSPRKKRKLSIQTGDNGGESCKNCKCKKSKCLKLYCECFAAGVYCIDICNCHDCYNKPEFEETVLGTRQQIESRNPLAFVPKIIRAPDSSPSVGEECKETPASARHKRGCNCKKSQCLKKYCECYQAGVGCADGCRCEGCKNIFGRNEGSEDLEEKVQQTDALDLKNATTSALNDMEQKLTPEHLNVHKGTDFSPITPYLENPGPCRSDVEMGPVQRFTSPFAHPISSLTFQSPSTFLELLEEARNLGQANLQTHPTRCPGLISNSSELSPGWTRQDAMYKSTPLSQPLQQLTTVVADAVLNTSNAYQPLWQNYDASLSHIKRYMPALKMDIPANPSQLQATENAITIPVTPLLSNTTHTTQTTFGDLSESRYQQSAWLTDEDDSPSVLRELNSFCAPEVVTKTRSPQQKRIFSYQRNPKAVNLKSNASGLASWSGGKFIFQSLPNTGYPDKPR